MYYLRRGITLCALLAALPCPASVQRAARIDLSLEIVSGCEVESGLASGAQAGVTSLAAIDFGTLIDPSRPLDTRVTGSTQSPITVSCSSRYTGLNAPTIMLDAGVHAIGIQRRMAGSAGSFARYGLYRDPARSDPYDPGRAVQLAIPTAGIATPIPIYGRVPQPAGLADGTYTDTVTLTVSY